MERKTLYALSGWFATGFVARWLIKKTSGILTLTLTAVAVLAFLMVLRLLLLMAARYFNKSPRLAWLSRLAMLSMAVSLSLVLFEGFLQGMALLHKARAGDPTLTIPEEWKERPANVPGAAHAWYWHDVLHVYNDDAMRRVGEFPPRGDAFRVMVLGDSLTFGYGVKAELTYSSLIEKELGKKYRIEVCNLGRCGDQSEDICRTLRTHLPILKPDLVVYGVCLNDFLFSGQGQYASNTAWSVRFPYQKHYTEKTKIGGFLAKRYDNFLMALGIRVDFMEDICRDFGGCQVRFGKDVKEMNDLVSTAGLPPVVTMVLHAGGTESTKCLSIIDTAERLLSKAGMRVIPSRSYLEKQTGCNMTVSRWEGHPNAEAHANFAMEFLPIIEEAPGLEKYRR